MAFSYTVEIIETGEKTYEGKDVNIYRLLCDGKPLLDVQSETEMNMLELAEKYQEEVSRQLSVFQADFIRAKMRQSRAQFELEDIERLIAQKRKKVNEETKTVKSDGSDAEHSDTK